MGFPDFGDTEENAVDVTVSPQKAKLPTEADVRIVLQPFTGNGGLVSEKLRRDKKYISWFMDHEAKPSFLYQYTEKFNAFLAEVAQKKEGFPASIPEMQEMWKVVYVITKGGDSGDVDKLGRKQYA